MQNDLKYRVGSREIIELVGALRSGRLTKSAFFQRNLVWRDTHKREFIETILSGMPFPQIFLARGKIDLDSMEAYTCVVDGQQRLSSIEEYVEGKFPVFGRTFSELNAQEKEQFLKYEVAVIDFDLTEEDDRLKDVFKRLNRTYYSLSTIEKLASEFSGSEFLIGARALCGDFNNDPEVEETGDTENPFLIDPSIGQDTISWAKGVSVDKFSELIRGDKVFSNYEAARKVPLMFVLNMMATYVFASYYNRNEKVKEFLELYNGAFPERDATVARFEEVGGFIQRLELAPGSFWLRKANFFTMCVELAKCDFGHVDIQDVRARLRAFSEKVPDSYMQAQREAVNNKKERVAGANIFLSMFYWVTKAFSSLALVLRRCPQIF